MTKTQKLRSLLQTKSIVKIMGGHNALGAKLIERNGFDGVWASGFEIATAHGVPDANILTMTENLDVALNINDASSLPVVCDCDTGYGNAINVMHMIKKYDAAGIAGVVIEDKCFPKINSFIPGRQELASIEEFVGKIQAAIEARSSAEGLMIFARIEALIAGWGMAEALKRALAYYEAGADGIVIHSKSKTPDEIFTFARLWNEKVKGECPLVAIPTTYSIVTADQLAAQGFKMVIYANHGIRAVVRSMNDVFKRIQTDDSTQNVEKDIASMQELFQLQGMHTYQEQEKLYSRKGEKISAVIPAAADHRFQPELSTYLQDRPLCMLEIAGKPLIEHQLDVLRSVEIQDFKVVAGFREDKIQTVGIEKIINKDYAGKGSAHSVLCGLEKTEGKVLISYADIIYDRHIPEALLKSPHAITLIIDRAFKTLPRRDKILDVVVTAEADDADTIRKMRVAMFKKILMVGKKIEASLAHHEFIGMMLLSNEGAKIMKDAWRNAQILFENKPFYESTKIEKASMTDLLQFVIDSGHEVFGLVIEHGWSEIYSLEDYERINHFFLGQQGKEMRMSSVTL